jgi:hypothetical protein
MSWIAVPLAGISLAAYAALQVLGRMAGTTGAERRQQLPGDELVDSATIVTKHAIDAAAEPEEVWPWLTQLGWHLGGWYTPQWVPADYVMAMGMLRGLKRRVEAHRPPAPSGRDPLDQAAYEMAAVRADQP